MRMSGHRRRSGVKSMGRKAGRPAVTLAVTTPMHRARPSSTARMRMRRATPFDFAKRLLDSYGLLLPCLKAVRVEGICMGRGGD